MLRASAISVEVMAARGYRTVTDEGELAAFGFARGQRRTPGLLLPLWTTDGGNGLYVYRPDNPRVVEEKRKGKRKDGTYPNRVIRYEYPQNSGMRLDCPPGCRPALGYPKVPLWVTEGQKKADALASCGRCAVALLGIWNWKGQNQLGGVTFLNDWDFVALKGRDVRIVFDSDVWTNPDVRQALARLGEHLARKGAKVSTAYLPPRADGGKQGVDDFLAAGNTIADLEELVQSQAPVPEAVTSKRVLTADRIEALARLGYSFRLNDVDDSVDVNGVRISDPVRAEIHSKMRDLGFVGMVALEDAYMAEAYVNRYHPVREYLDSLKWDGEPHISTLATYFSNPDGAFPVWLRRWLIGSVAKVFAAEQNPMLVLDGPQGIGKSYFARWLCPLPVYHLEDQVNTEDKDTEVRLMSKWIWEVGEVGRTMRKSDREALKFLISKRTVTVRKPYGHYDTVKPALASFIGTVNNEAGLLSDPTGSRRFLVCRIEEIEWSGLEHGPGAAVGRGLRGLPRWRVLAVDRRGKQSANPDKCRLRGRGPV